MVVIVLSALGAAPVHAAREWADPTILSAPGADAWPGGGAEPLALTPTGTAMVTWRETGDGGAVVKAARKPAGAPLAEPQTLGAGSYSSPDVAAPADGRAVVAVGDAGDPPVAGCAVNPVRPGPLPGAAAAVHMVPQGPGARSAGHVRRVGMGQARSREHDVRVGLRR
jgi:hypothetical protein